MLQIGKVCIFISIIHVKAGLVNSYTPDALFSNDW